MFDKEQFQQILIKAIGDRTATEYSEISGVNRTYISKYLNKRLDNPPSPDIIARLSKYAQNEITYFDFMEAAGYIKTSISENSYKLVKYDENGEEIGNLSVIKAYDHPDQVKFIENVDGQNILTKNERDRIEREILSEYLNERDRNDIARQLEKTMELLEQQDSVMFDGEAMDEETKDLLRQSLENSMRMAKAINKKYTPKKHRK